MDKNNIHRGVTAGNIYLRQAKRLDRSRVGHIGSYKGHGKGEYKLAANGKSALGGLYKASCRQLMMFP
jgi:hypothetical protein